LVSDDITEFLVIFVDEVFDSMPDPGDKSHERIGQVIYRLFSELENQDYSFFKEISAKYEEFKKQKIEFIDGKFSEGDDSDESDDSDFSIGTNVKEGMEEVPKKVVKDPKQVSEEFAKFQEEEEAARLKKKAKKNQGFGVQVDAEEPNLLQQHNKLLAEVKEEIHPEGKADVQEASNSSKENNNDDDEWEMA
jgi:hypothetical protein